MKAQLEDARGSRQTVLPAEDWKQPRRSTLDANVGCNAGAALRHTEREWSTSLHSQHFVP